MAKTITGQCALCRINKELQLKRIAIKSYSTKFCGSKDEKYFTRKYKIY